MKPYLAHPAKGRDSCRRCAAWAASGAHCTCAWVLRPSAFGAPRGAGYACNRVLPLRVEGPMHGLNLAQKKSKRTPVCLNKLEQAVVRACWGSCADHYLHSLHNTCNHVNVALYQLQIQLETKTGFGVTVVLCMVSTGIWCGSYARGEVVLKWLKAMESRFLWRCIFVIFIYIKHASANIRK